MDPTTRRLSTNPSLNRSRPLPGRAPTRPSRLTPNRLWLGFFGVWVLFLSGILPGFTGTPGVIQAIRLRGLLGIKQQELARLEDDLHTLQIEAEGLENSAVVQERAVRRVLGFVAPDEWVFEF